MPVTPTKRTKGASRFPNKRHNRLSDSEGDSDTDGEEEKEIKDPEKIFYCKFAIDSRRGIFYNFQWEHHRRAALAKSTPPSTEAGPSSQKAAPQWGEGLNWDVREEGSKPPTRRNRQSMLENDIRKADGDGSDEYQDNGASTDREEMEDSQSSESDDQASGHISGLRTPSKKRKRDSCVTVTPHKRKRTIFVEATPHSKAALSRRKKHTLMSSPKRKSLVSFPVRYPAQSLGTQASLAHVPRDPWLRSLHALHVGSRPNALPCREDEYASVLKCVGELLEEGSGGCICGFV